MEMTSTLRLFWEVFSYVNAVPAYESEDGGAQADPLLIMCNSIVALHVPLPPLEDKGSGLWFSSGTCSL
jgi:hypothetical protein